MELGIKKLLKQNITYVIQSKRTLPTDQWVDLKSFEDFQLARRFFRDYKKARKQDVGTYRMIRHVVQTCIIDEKKYRG